MNLREYLMESDIETRRLELKTHRDKIVQHAVWAGIRQGIRVADIGCGPGKTTYFLYKLVQPHGSACGIDICQDRIQYAKKHYSGDQIEFIKADIREPLTNLGLFDFVWVRFILEYFRTKSFEILQNISRILKPGGIICLIDLDYNCMSHFGLPEKIQGTINKIIHSLEKNADFDPYAGRKLYSFLYDLGYRDIDVHITAHHLIFGQMNGIDLFNWTQKIEIVKKMSICSFDEYQGGEQEFFQELIRYFRDPRRFTYTPVICCKGRKPD